MCLTYDWRFSASLCSSPEQVERSPRVVPNEIIMATACQKDKIETGELYRISAKPFEDHLPQRP